MFDLNILFIPLFFSNLNEILVLILNSNLNFKKIVKILDKFTQKYYKFICKINNINILINECKLFF